MPPKPERKRKGRKLLDWERKGSKKARTKSSHASAPAPAAAEAAAAAAPGSTANDAMDLLVNTACDLSRQFQEMTEQMSRDASTIRRLRTSLKRTEDDLQRKIDDLEMQIEQAEEAARSKSASLERVTEARGRLSAQIVDVTSRRKVLHNDMRTFLKFVADKAPVTIKSAPDEVKAVLMKHFPEDVVHCDDDDAFLETHMADADAILTGAGTTLLSDQLEAAQLEGRRTFLGRSRPHTPPTGMVAAARKSLPESGDDTTDDESSDDEIDHILDEEEVPRTNTTTIEMGRKATLTEQLRRFVARNQSAEKLDDDDMQWLETCVRHTSREDWTDEQKEFIDRHLPNISCDDDDEDQCSSVASDDDDEEDDEDDGEDDHAQ